MISEIDQLHSKERVWIHTYIKGLTSCDGGENPSDSFGFAVDKDKYYHVSLRRCLARFPREMTPSLFPKSVSNRSDYGILLLQMISQGL